LKEEKRAEWFGAVLSLLYEFNWPMGETEILQRSMKSSDVEDLRSLLADLKKADLISESKVPGSWKLTKKGKEMVRKSLG
jgi:predicted transcriptional regulator